MNGATKAGDKLETDTIDTLVLCLLFCWHCIFLEVCQVEFWLLIHSLVKYR